MAAADPVENVILPSDMNSNESWEANVPYPTPISISDSNNILAELSMYTAINAPMPICDDVPSPCSEDTDDALFRTTPCKQNLKRTFSSPTADSNKRPKYGKAEFNLITEPVTPCAQPQPALAGITRIAVPAPMSPTCQSLCTDEPDEMLSMPPTPVPTDVPFLPTLTREQSAKRRALRRATLKRNRSRKEEGLAVVKAEPTKCESDMAQSGEPLDKKAARAIRNREAAMKSRVEAKQKMRKLQDENESLSGKVKSLSAENEALTAQLKNLLQHTLGVQVADGQDVKDVFNAFARMANRSA